MACFQGFANVNQPPLFAFFRNLSPGFAEREAGRTASVRPSPCIFLLIMSHPNSPRVSADSAAATALSSTGDEQAQPTQDTAAASDNGSTGNGSTDNGSTDNGSHQRWSGRFVVAGPAMGAGRQPARVA